jgi:hypothetical protein
VTHERRDSQYEAISWMRQCLQLFCLTGRLITRPDSKSMKRSQFDNAVVLASYSPREPHDHSRQHEIDETKPANWQRRACNQWSSGRKTLVRWCKTDETKPKIGRIGKDYQICRKGGGADAGIVRSGSGCGHQAGRSVARGRGPAQQASANGPTSRSHAIESGCSFLGTWRNSICRIQKGFVTRTQGETAPSRPSTYHRGQTRADVRTPIDRAVGVWYSIRKYIDTEKLGLRPAGFEGLFVTDRRKTERAGAR